MKRISPSTYNKLAKNLKRVLCKIDGFELQETKCNNKEGNCCKDNEYYILVVFKETGYGVEGIYTITQEIAFKLLLLFNIEGSMAFKEEVEYVVSVIRDNGRDESY